MDVLQEVKNLRKLSTPPENLEFYFWAKLKCTGVANWKPAYEFNALRVVTYINKDGVLKYF
jgi:hypothetical protein